MGNGISSRRVLRQPMVNRDHYFRFVRYIGKSSYGRIDVVRDVNDNDKEYACKTSEKKKFRSSLVHRNDVRREIEILRKLAGNAHIVQFKAAFEDDDEIHLVMELCRGGTVWKRMLKIKRGFSEREAAVLFRQIIGAVEYCHTNGVMHRDLNPENLMFLEPEKDGGIDGVEETGEPDEDDGAGGIDVAGESKVVEDGDEGSLSIKLIEFEYSVFYEIGALYTRYYGWDNYMAPEVHSHEYGIEADIWSTGALLFTFLDGKEPLRTVKDNKGIHQAILDGDIKPLVDEWDDMSEEAKALVNQILTIDPSQRPTVSQILNKSLDNILGVR